MFTFLFTIIRMTWQLIWVEGVLKICKFLAKHWWVLPSIMAVMIVALIVTLIAII